MPSRPRLALTLGDPSGVGPEVLAKALTLDASTCEADLTVIGNADVLASALATAGGKLVPTVLLDPRSPPQRSPGTVPVVDPAGAPRGPFPTGEISVPSALAAHRWVETAVTLALEGVFDAIVTAPVNKSAFARAGIRDTGHQEILKRLTGAPLVATMLVSGSLRCVHLSTHKSLREACLFVTRENILAALDLTDSHFRRWGFAEPRIAVAALNPHASDNGLIGHEEIEEIGPAIDEARRRGLVVSGPHAADSVFNRAINGEFDAVLVMYHDQGHIPIKVHGFERSISVNLGLPFVRTSVDHGTAFDIAGKGQADPTSMREAIRTAIALASGSGLG